MYRSWMMSAVGRCLTGSRLSSMRMHTATMCGSAPRTKARWKADAAVSREVASPGSPAAPLLLERQHPQPRARRGASGASQRLFSAILRQQRRRCVSEPLGVTARCRQRGSGGGVGGVALSGAPPPPPAAGEGAVQAPLVFFLRAARDRTCPLAARALLPARISGRVRRRGGRVLPSSRPPSGPAAAMAVPCSASPLPPAAQAPRQPSSSTLGCQWTL